MKICGKRAMQNEDPPVDPGADPAPIGASPKDVPLTVA